MKIWLLKKFYGCQVAAAMFCLLALAAPAGADETLCRAEVHLRDGSVVNIRDVAAQDPDPYALPSRFMLVRTEYTEREEVYLDRLRSLLRMASVKDPTEKGLICFNYEDQKGRWGRFWVDPDTPILGRTGLGFWSSPLAEVDYVELKCPSAGQLDLRAPAPKALPKPDGWPY